MMYTYLEINASLGLGLSLVSVVDERPLVAVEDEPPLAPRFEFPAHFVQVAATAARVEDQLIADL